MSIFIPFLRISLGLVLTIADNCDDMSTLTIKGNVALHMAIRNLLKKSEDRCQTQGLKRLLSTIEIFGNSVIRDFEEFK